MSAGTFVDENGQVYIVDPRTGRLIPTGETKSPSDEIRREITNRATSAARDRVVREIEDKLPSTGLGDLINGGSAGSAGLPAPGDPNFIGPLLPGGSQGAGAAGRGMFSLQGVGGAGNAILPAAGAYGLYNLSQNRERIGTGKGYLQGAASGAAMGSYFGLPGAIAGGTLGLLANAFGIGHQSRTKIEEKRRKELAEQGLAVPNSDVKEWELNEKFKQSRQESDLTGKDIRNAATLYGMAGYAGLDEAKKDLVAQEAIKRGLVREHHGTIDVSTNPEFEQFLQSQLPSQGGGGERKRDKRAERAAKKAVVDSIVERPQAEITKGPRYDLGLQNLISNPYL